MFVTQLSAIFKCLSKIWGSKEGQPVVMIAQSVEEISLRASTGLLIVVANTMDRMYYTWDSRIFKVGHPPVCLCEARFSHGVVSMAIRCPEYRSTFTVNSVLFKPGLMKQKFYWKKRCSRPGH